jgi:protein involved in temperature-dependent protein secretion
LERGWKCCSRSIHASPFEHVAHLHVDTPKRLRDLLWAPVRVQPSGKMKDLELGAAHARAHPDRRCTQSEVRLGRVTVVELLADGRDVPVGQRSCWWMTPRCRFSSCASS